MAYELRIDGCWIDVQYDHDDHDALCRCTSNAPHQVDRWLNAESCECTKNCKALLCKCFQCERMEHKHKCDGTMSCNHGRCCGYCEACDDDTNIILNTSGRMACTDDYREWRQKRDRHNDDNVESRYSLPCLECAHPECQPRCEHGRLCLECDHPMCKGVREYDEEEKYGDVEHHNDEEDERERGSARGPGTPENVKEYLDGYKKGFCDAYCKLEMESCQGACQPKVKKFCRAYLTNIGQASSSDDDDDEY